MPTPAGRPPLAADGLPEGMPDQHGIPTLGWDVLAWGEEYLAQPDGTCAGDPWRWTATQARIVAWWYAVDAQGGWLYRRGQIVLPKGSGKVRWPRRSVVASSRPRFSSMALTRTAMRSVFRTRARSFSSPR